MGDNPTTYPGACRPDRQRTVDSHGLAIAVNEWGAPDAPPLVLVHGGFDFAGTFDVFAPMLADGGWRVVAWDHRGHGDSEHAALYSWEADVRDPLAVHQLGDDRADRRARALQGRRPDPPAARTAPAAPRGPS